MPFRSGDIGVRRLAVVLSIIGAVLGAYFWSMPEFRKLQNVKYWRDQRMVERWVASAWLLTENRFRRISGLRDLWAPATILGRKTETEILQEKVT
jgi:hypothetical protein